MVIKDIYPPEELGRKDNDMTVSFAFNLEELELARAGLKLLYVEETDPKREKHIIALIEGLKYASHTLKTIADDVVRELGEI